MYDKITLSNMLYGALEEKFQHELKKVIANIADINTSHKDKRKINISIELKPDEMRQDLKIAVNVTSKLACVKGEEGIVHLARESGEYGIYADQAKQPSLFDQLKKKEEEKQKQDNIVPVNFTEAK